MPKLKYNKELLNQTLQRDEATLIGEYEKVNRETIINFRCKCGNESSKILKYCKTHGTLCKECVGKITKEKIKQTNLERYGTEFSFQSNLVKDKIKKANIKKYGVENPSQSSEIKQKKKDTTLKNYGVENPSQSVEVQNKKEKTSLKNYGTKHPLQSEKQKEIVKQTNIERYGVEYTMQSEEVRNKSKETSINKYGTEYPSQSNIVKEKIKQTNIEKYGVEYTMQSEEVKQKSINTSIQKYGVSNPAQSQEIMEKTQKNAKKFKEFTMPSGDVRKVQGYEPFALTDLLKTYNEDQIKTERKEVPRVSYEVDGKRKYHFPDIFIPHENKIVEVKSTWTYKCKEDNIQLKKKACEDKGYLYEIWCYDGKGNRVEV